MIQAISAITYIENNLNKLINNKQLFGKIKRSNTTLSLYLNTKKPSPEPQKTARISNHHPNMQHMAKGRNKPWETTNIGVEFFEPVKQANGKIKRNRFITNVIQNVDGTIQPFTITVYEYKAELLEETDVPLIYNAIVSFITNNFFVDPLKETPKAAKPILKTCKIIEKNRKANNDALNNNNGETTNTIEEPNKENSSLTESDLRFMIKSCIKKVLSEQTKQMLGDYEVVDGTLNSCKAPSLKQFGYYNEVRMYFSPSQTYCLMRREDNGTLFFTEIVNAPELGDNQTKFVPRKPNDVPPIILRDAQFLLRKAKNQRKVIS